MNENMFRFTGSLSRKSSAFISKPSRFSVAGGGSRGWKTTYRSSIELPASSGANRAIPAWGVVLLILLSAQLPAWGKTISFVDGGGETFKLEKSPERVVSLVPSVTEIIFALGAADALVGLTRHSTNLAPARGKTVVGGYFSPSLEAVEKARPDMIILAPIHNALAGHFSAADVKVVQVRAGDLALGEDSIRMMGTVFGKEEEARELIRHNNETLGLIRRKTANVPAEKRKRVVRLMGRNKVMAPGDDSFQNELIRAAGGIPPEWGKNGNVVTVSREAWMRFNPQVIYGCGEDREAAKALFDRPGWKDVDAVKNGNIRYFPCDLTCRAATHTGYFVSWLASVMYTDEFARAGDQISEDRVFQYRPISIDLPYIKEARVAESTLYDFVNRTLVIDFNTPQKVVSTLDGAREGILSVGNHYSPPQCWQIGHRRGLNGVRDSVLGITGKDAQTASFLYTGADMNNLSIRKEAYREMEVHALVTAGVRSNAVRMSRDLGNYYEPGTINILIMTNMRLTDRAMTRAVISATEAKSAALSDMDVRSAYRPALYAATGTGTDNVLVVQGSGLGSPMGIDNAGGHSKMGELVARAVHAGVTEAVLKQNGISAQRDIFQRLAERRISVSKLVNGAWCDCMESRSEYSAAVEKALLNPRYAAFIEAAMALSDARERGLLNDLSAFEAWSRIIAGELAGMDVEKIESRLPEDLAPEVLRDALNAVMNGIRIRLTGS